jgi:hypothetical protein
MGMMRKTIKFDKVTGKYPMPSSYPRNYSVGASVKMCAKDFHERFET